TDPGPGGLAGVLTYDLPFAGTQGDITSFGPPSDSSIDVGDVIRFNGDGTLLFYSDNVDGFDSLADTFAPPGAFYANTATPPETGTESSNSFSYKPTAGQPGYDANAQPFYILQSDGALPAFSSFLTGSKTVTLGDDPTPGNSDSRLSANDGTPIVDFRNPTTS